MYKKQIKLSILISTILMIGTSTSAFASSTYTRLSGADRYQTSSKIALNGWTQSDYAILASGEDYPDALCAAPLAGKYKAPILLTEKNSIPASTLATIQQLQVKNIFIVGGTGVIYQAVQDQLTALGITTTRLAGQNRYDTDIAVAKQLGTVSQIAVVTGENYADALSIAPIAVKLGMPIILVERGSIPKAVTDYVGSQSISKTYVIGRGTSINNESGLPNVTEINGADKYARNIAIISAFKSSLNFSTIYLATGENFADALSGSVLAGLNGNPLILVGSDITNEENLLQLVAPTATIKVLGGIGAVPDSTVIGIGNPTQTTTSSMPTGVQATLTSTDVATIQWNTVANANSYNVYYSTDNVSYALAGATTANEDIINLSSISALQGITNAPIYFEVAAVTNGTQSAFSAYTSIIPTQTTTSSIPTGVQATITSTGVATIQWNTVLNANSYNVYYSTDNVSYAIAGATTANEDIINLSSISALQGITNAPIYFEVAAVTNGTQSVLSAYTSLIPSSIATTGDVDTTTTDGDINTIAATSNNDAFNAPTNITARIDSNGLVTMRWNRAAYGEHYNIYVTYGDSSYTIVHRTRGNKVQFTLDSDKVLKALSRGGSISFVVKTVSNSSESKQSSSIQAITPDSWKDKQGQYNQNKGNVNKNSKYYNNNNSY